MCTKARCLTVEVDTGAVLLMGALYTNLYYQHYVTPDTVVSRPHQSDSNPTLDVSAHTRAGFLPL